MQVQTVIHILPPDMNKGLGFSTQNPDSKHSRTNLKTWMLWYKDSITQVSVDVHSSLQPHLRPRLPSVFFFFWVSKKKLKREILN